MSPLSSRTDLRWCVYYRRAVCDAVNPQRV
nr:MAG TPA: Antifungal peptide termicin [Caudoviricetes sp.]